ncbi:MAG: hypothetical protein UX09_C0029G0001 [Candidatus Uhrbacteria bacterium GW2011_GWE2_45_35]|uniref:PPM-type phosphatase domain-containing protein n=1 Tax=Candidatus Uhrbacteria bacterium GW2011_GWE2_45_35 TaxID=1618993 RepID=A0A0G1MHA9_9BACT|nr:MAG: hypothetical protein UX09_C0029G0001 [Candidatus Uhrbacteria bacterium GW2011_GWE2_45_35]
MKSTFELIHGSITGREHRLIGRNNQDASHLVFDERHLVAVVCDGCGSGLSSECGARLGARLVVETLFRHARQVRVPEELSAAAGERILERTRLDVLAGIRILAGNLGPSLSEVVENFFLFTVIGVWLSPTSAIFFALGDGVIEINRERFELGPFPNNAPPYLAYSLFETMNERPPLRFQIIKTLPAEELQSFLLASDGLTDYLAAERLAVPDREELVGNLDKFYQDDKFYKNPDMLRRHLAIVNRSLTGGAGGRLADDTTMIVGRRRQEMP